MTNNQTPGQYDGQMFFNEHQHMRVIDNKSQANGGLEEQQNINHLTDKTYQFKYPKSYINDADERLSMADRVGPPNKGVYFKPDNFTEINRAKNDTLSEEGEKKQTLSYH